MAKFQIQRLSLVVSLIIASYAIFTPLQAFIDHMMDFHLDREALSPPERENDWIIEQERRICHEDWWKDDGKGSSSPGDNGGRDFTPDRDK